MQVHVEDLFYKSAIGIWLSEERAGRYYVAAPTNMMFAELPDGALRPPPTIEMSSRDARDFFQGLCNELARLGYRPNTDRLSGELDAKKEHLEREMKLHDRVMVLFEHTVRQSLLPPRRRE